MIEHRKTQRFDLKLPFELVRSGNRPATAQGQTMNLSSNGVLFEADHVLTVGEVVEYFVTLPTGQNPAEDVRLRCMGKIIRVQDRYAAATMERYEFIRQRSTSVGTLAEAAAS